MMTAAHSLQRDLELRAYCSEYAIAKSLPQLLSVIAWRSAGNMAEAQPRQPAIDAILEQ